MAIETFAEQNIWYWGSTCTCMARTMDVVVEWY